MANANRSKGITRKASPRKVGKVTQEPTTAQLIEIGRTVLRLQDQAVKDAADRDRRQASINAQVAQDKLIGVTLRGPRLDHANKLLCAINESAYSIEQTATTAVCTTDPREVACLLTMIQNAAILTCRYADVISEYLSGSQYGNYSDLLQPISDEAAARMEREALETAAE